MIPMEVLGTIGSVCFAISGIPAAYEAYKAKYCDYNWAFLVLWALGEGLMTAYAIGTDQYILLLNYAPNAVCLAILVCFNRVNVPVSRRRIRLVCSNPPDAP